MNRGSTLLVLVLVVMLAWAAAGKLAVRQGLGRRATRTLRRAALSAAVVVFGVVLLAAAFMGDDRLLAGVGVVVVLLGASDLWLVRRRAG